MRRYAVFITSAFAAVAAIVALLNGLDPAVATWCKYFGLFCTYEVASPEISRSVTGGSTCSSGDGTYCIQPSTKYRRLIVDTKKFIRTKDNNPYPLGNFNDGDSSKVAASDSGWYSKEASDQKICIVVYARTTACERKFSITGQLKATERITLF